MKTLAITAAGAVAVLGVLTPHAMAKRPSKTSGCHPTLIGGIVCPYKVGSQIFYLSAEDIRNLQQKSNLNLQLLRQQKTFK